MNYSEKDMAALINEVETQFASHLNKAEDETETKLAKSEEIETKEEKTVETTETLEKNETELNYDEEDYVEMDKMYASMTKSEVEAHYESIKKNIEEEKVEVVTEEINKSEVELNDLHKSEIEAKDGEIEDLKKSLSKLTVAMTDFLKGRAPKRKAVTKMEYVAKSEEINKSEETVKEDFSKLTTKEISNRLTAKIRNGLEKSEREKINEFYNGDLKLDAIKHLL